MACLVSMTVSTPLPASRSFTIEIPPRISVVVRLSSQPTSGTARKPSASCSTNTSILSLNRSFQDRLHTPSKLFESQKIIFGYWVGPDIDDGWGYVEAFVSTIT